MTGHPRLEVALSLLITAVGSFVVVSLLIAQRVLRRATNGAFP